MTNEESIQRSIDRNTAYEADITLLEREVERLRASIRHMCDELCSPGDCQAAWCPRGASQLGEEHG